MLNLHCQAHVLVVFHQLEEVLIKELEVLIVALHEAQLAQLKLSQDLVVDGVVNYAVIRAQTERNLGKHDRISGLYLLRRVYPQHVSPLRALLTRHGGLDSVHVLHPHHLQLFVVDQLRTQQ